mgnify:CR=1 FL=1
MLTGLQVAAYIQELRTLRHEIMPLVANTHTETTVTGTAMTQSYHMAKDIVKKHVNANEKDVLIFAGTGMTGVVNKLQRILGIKYPKIHCST